MDITADLMTLLPRAAHHLRPVNLRVVHATNGPAALHVFGRPAGFSTYFSVYVRPDDLGLFFTDLGPFLKAAPVWTAWLNVRHPLAADWSFGYQEARRAILPAAGVYQPSNQLDVLSLTRHPQTPVARARLAGVRAFLQQLRPAAQPQALPNAAD